jgi:type I restriction enzyme, S subunit
MAMNNETMMLLERHFDAAFAAPDGIKKLRDLILTLAMQGKLVPQDPNDEPASELLKSIELEKQQLSKNGKIKALKLLPQINRAEIQYELPKGWEWVRLNDFGIWKSGSTPSRTNSSYYGGGIPWVKSGEVKQGRIFTTEETIAQQALQECSLDLNSIGSVLMAMYGANIGEVGILEIEATTNQAVCACKPYSLIDKNFLSYLLISLKQNFISQGAGAAQPNISKEKIIHTIVPLLPLAEQRRIVAEIDRLMARCDELEKLRADRSQKLLTVHTAALDALLKAKDSSDFSTAWHFITQHFSELYSVKENVAELRKAILQLAVMGKLVPQESTPPMGSLQSILAESSINGVSKGPTSDTSATEVLRISAGTSQKDFYVNENDFKHVDLSVNEIQKFKLVSGDLLACRFNGNLHYVGRFSYYRGDSGHVQVNPDKLIRFRIDTELHCPLYVCYMMNAAQTRDAIEAMCATTAGNIGLSAGKLKTIKIPLPPLAEQRLIVDEIDRLEESIEAAKGKQADLLDALMSQV